MESILKWLFESELNIPMEQEHPPGAPGEVADVFGQAGQLP